jgi:hypothetical protein
MVKWLSLDKHRCLIWTLTDVAQATRDKHLSCHRDLLSERDVDEIGV